MRSPPCSRPACLADQRLRHDRGTHVRQSGRRVRRAHRRHRWSGVWAGGPGAEALGYQSIGTDACSCSVASAVIRVRPWIRAVATISRSAGSFGHDAANCSDASATSTVSGKTSSPGALAASRNHAGHEPPRALGTMRSCARSHAASLSEIAAKPTFLPEEAEAIARRARRPSLASPSTLHSHACVSSRYFTSETTRPPE